MDDLKAPLAKLGDADEAERIYAVEDIGYLNAPEGVAPLLERLRIEPSRAVREAIFQAFIRIDADAAIEAAIGLLGSDDPQMRNQAVEILRGKGSAAIPFLAAVMHTGDKDLRKLTLDVLSGSQALGAEPIYAAALSDEDPNVVITAVENIGRARDRTLRPRVEELLISGAHPMLIGACLEALVGIGDEHSMAAVRSRFPNLAELPDFLLLSCLKAMGALGSEEDFAEVAGLLAIRGAHLRPGILGALSAIHQRYPVTTHQEDLLPLLRIAVEDLGAPLCCYQAVRALGFVAARDDVHAFLIECLASPERLIRLAAIESLREASRPELDQIFAAQSRHETDEEVVQALNRWPGRR
jgi:HEAT repeat protein